MAAWIHSVVSNSLLIIAFSYFIFIYFVQYIYIAVFFCIYEESNYTAKFGKKKVQEEA
jgi:hypothetical protein